MAVGGAPGSRRLSQGLHPKLPVPTLPHPRSSEREALGRPAQPGCPVLLASWPESCLVLLSFRNKARHTVSLESETAR